VLLHVKADTVFTTMFCGYYINGCSNP